ncbi:MAG TPA: hypothetical protein VE172_12660 [Stackebrandtia sp.]|jgi:hypothetical protein|uniref:hypothetical protein n=1 Tax=Stackebrandtia sp. TaxID=2023065 RepID=UPI002D28B350|nr:hypothetical protein [Stackebrandtia sp.]HZE39653.1 hypothetical protein [Stackebrandtia sp.]
MGETERVTVELSSEVVAAIHKVVGDDAAALSSYVVDAVMSKLHRDQSLADLQVLFERKGQGPSPEHLAWARDVLGVEADGTEAGT